MNHIIRKYKDVDMQMQSFKKQVKILYTNNMYNYMGYIII